MDVRMEEGGTAHYLFDPNNRDPMGLSPTIGPGGDATLVSSKLKNLVNTIKYRHKSNKDRVRHIFHVYSERGLFGGGGDLLYTIDSGWVDEGRETAQLEAFALQARNGAIIAFAKEAQAKAKVAQVALEIATRLTNAPLDTFVDGIEFIKKPTVLGGMSIIIPGVSFKKADDLIEAAVDAKKVRQLAPAKRNSGSTVLGHYPEYAKMADDFGHRRFDIPKGAWDKMTDAQRWEANQKFLDRTISRGDDIILSTPLDKVKPESFFARELEYLSGKGYRPSADGTRLIPGGN